MSFVLLVCLNLGILMLMFLFFNRKIGQRLEEQALLERLRQEVGDIIMELNRTTERNIGLIEDRVKILRDLLESSDKRLVLMKRETEKQDLSTQVYTHLQKKPVPAKENFPKEKKSFSAEEILDLYNKGISVELIANKLETTVGEVELVISLKAGKGRE